MIILPNRRKAFRQSATDPDALAYIQAVEAADGQALESGVTDAINDFVVGCKSDGIWPAIKASCILAGSRTLAGALVPLVGSAPTNNNFVSGDYDRRLGLLGDGSTKYLNSNRSSDTDPRDSHHLAFYTPSLIASGMALAGETTGNRNGIYLGNPTYFPLRSGNNVPSSGVDSATVTGFIGGSRANSSSIDYRIGGNLASINSTSNTPPSQDIGVFCRLLNGLPGNYIAGRIQFYSIGESLDLTLLDARVTALINAIDTAIP